MEPGNAWPDPGAAEAADSGPGCSKFLVWHSAYLDDDLSAAERAEHEAHEAACSSCAHYASVLRRGTGILREIPELTPSADFHERLQHRIFHVQDETAFAGGRRRRAGWLLAAAAASVVVAGPLLWNRAGRDVGLPAASASEQEESGAVMVRIADSWHTPTVPQAMLPGPLPPSFAGYSPVVVRTPQYQPVSYQLLVGE